MQDDPEYWITPCRKVKIVGLESNVMVSDLNKIAANLHLEEE